MKKKKIMSGTALLMAAALTLQSVDWSTLDVFAKDENFADTKVLQLSFENNVDDESDYIGNLSSYDLSNVDVTDAYLTNAEDKDIEYLLSLSSDRLLAGFRETAGLSMNGATR